MIVLHEKKEPLHVVHLIMGPETDFQFDFTGQCVIDITQQIKDMKMAENVVIVLNKCQSEEQLGMELARRNAMSNHQEMMKNFQEFVENKEKNIVPGMSAGIPGLKCPVCLKPDSAVINNGLVVACKTCQKINEHVPTKAEESKPLSKEDQKSLLKEIEKEHPGSVGLFKRIVNRRKKIQPPEIKKEERGEDEFPVVQ